MYKKVASAVNHAICELKSIWKSNGKCRTESNKLKDLLTTILPAYAITDKGENAVM
jgi:hypothetical protein